ncbi:DUF3526 domain-containing protein [Pedobacter kyonggii]|uniref:DUF3526 domain-containing protein n=1 Tax=Pedobacter kyonggii TaxID=1926871 RepID=A0A4Q9HA15_9SPHI|nr:DUF3526 domain-containing protein [Pedobacter kyonggii]TBO40710.1 DUF3526 domain-containing protein [Pedobacter kyonggii]
MKKSIYNPEFKLFFRNSSSWIGIIVLLITGFAGLYFGKTFINNQQAVIEKAAMLQKKNTLSNIDHFGKDIGLLFYHNKFSFANAPNAWAAFANGQRDINPYLISVTMLGLEGQIYDTDINNPVSLLLGNMDLSFVFIFLFPLVIIAFSYNLLSEQKESGVWSLLRAQTNQSFQVIWQKFLVRVAVIFSVALLLLFVAILYLHLPVDFIFFSITTLIIFYLAFWFAVSFFIISLAKSSNFNASALVAVWVLICIVIPASLNLFLTRKYPMPEALQNVINQREGNHEKWDMAKEVTMKPFFDHYPQLKQYPFPEEKTFSWFWYYAMQQMGDDQAIASRRAIENKLAARQRFTNTLAFFFPTIQTQLGINNMAGSDLNTHLDFQEAVRKYHEQIRLHFYPGIFLNKAVDSTDIKDYKLEKYSPQQIPSVWANLLSISILTVILIGTTVFNFKRQEQF